MNYQNTLNALLICNKPDSPNARAISDHIEALEKFSQIRIFLYSNLGDIHHKLDLNRFDVIIIHYSLNLLNNYYLTRKAKTLIRNAQALKVVFLQDEYRQINKMIDELHYLNTNILFTCFPEQEALRIYTKDKLPGLKVCSNLTGYIPEHLINTAHIPPMKDRNIHVGYRGRKLPFWYGELAYNKWNIIEKWQEHTKDEAIIADLSYQENDRIYGEQWTQFLLSCKTSLGVESGASVMDFTGELEKKVEAHQLRHSKDDFHKVQKKYLSPFEGLYQLNQISSRCFEAIILKTALVLYEGDYSGILIPWRHFIPLKKNFSNIKAVLSHIHDDNFLQSMADRAHEEIALNDKYHYRSFIKRFDKIVLKEFQLVKKTSVATTYPLEEFSEKIKHTPFKSRLYKQGLQYFRKLPTPVRNVVKRFFGT